MTSLLLLVIALILLFTFSPVGLIYTCIVSICSKERKLKTDIKEYFQSIAVGLDQTGNVVMRDIFNQILITSESTHQFGDIDETISSVLGKNQIAETLTMFGRLIVKMLDKFEPDHCKKSIENSTNNKQ